MSEPTTYTQEQMAQAVQQALSVEVPKAVNTAVAQTTQGIEERISKPIYCDGEFCNMKSWVYGVTLAAALIFGMLFYKFVIDRYLK